MKKWKPTGVWKRKLEQEEQPKETALGRAIRKAQLKASRERLENTLEAQMRFVGLPTPDRQYRFHSDRKWLFDFAWPGMRLAVEVDGGTWSGGAHVRGDGYQNDRDKDHAAQELGWTVLRFTSSDIHSGLALRQIEKMHKSKS